MVTGSATLAGTAFWRTSFPRRCSTPPRPAMATNAFAGRPAREYARAVFETPFPCRTQKAWRLRHLCSTARRSRGRPQRPVTANSLLRFIDFRMPPAWPRLKRFSKPLGNAPAIRHRHPLHFDYRATTHLRRGYSPSARKTLQHVRRIFRSCIEDQYLYRFALRWILVAEACCSRGDFYLVRAMLPMANLAPPRCSRAHGFGHLHSF